MVTPTTSRGTLWRAHSTHHSPLDSLDTTSPFLPPARLLYIFHALKHLPLLFVLAVCFWVPPPVSFLNIVDNNIDPHGKDNRNILQCVATQIAQQ